MAEAVSTNPLSEDLLQAASIVKSILENAEAERDLALQNTEEEDRHQQDVPCDNHNDESCACVDELSAREAGIQEHQRQCQVQRLVNGSKIACYESHGHVKDRDQERQQSRWDEEHRHYEQHQSREEQEQYPQKQQQEQHPQKQQQEQAYHHQSSGTHHVMASATLLHHQRQVTIYRRSDSLRRPGRPSRKRQRRIYFPEQGDDEDSSVQDNHLLQLAEAGLMHSEKPARKESRIDATTVEPATSTIRVLSSETYLRRLFVTASLARILSLDECLPRSMPASKRASSSRVVGRNDRGNRQEGGICEGQKELAIGDDDVDGDSFNNSDDSLVDGADSDYKTQNVVAFDNGQFKEHYPVTLIDSEGNRWTVTYVTTKRDNLHSGRLVDGWERFCSASGLRIGDVVEFQRIEKTEQRQRGEGGGSCRREAVARVVAHRRR